MKNPFESFFLAMFGWEKFVVDGTPGYLHASGFVVYHQGFDSE